MAGRLSASVAPTFELVAAVGGDQGCAAILAKAIDHVSAGARGVNWIACEVLAMPPSAPLALRSSD